MIELWRNLFRRRLRTFLTVLGIVVGTLALTVMGAMSEKINLLVNGALRYYETRVVVQAKAGSPGQIVGPPLDVSIVNQIDKVPGVAESFPTVYMYYTDNNQPASTSFGFPPLVIGVDAQRFSYTGDKYPVEVSKGTLFKPGDRGVAVVGVDLANYKKTGVGKELSIMGKQFKVVGIIKRTLTIRDNVVFIPLADAQELFAASLPPPLNQDPTSLASEIEVYPTDLKQADQVAAAINNTVSGVRANSPQDVSQQFRQQLVIFDVIIIGSAIIAVIVGGLAVLNTMAMAVSERTREIGIKKAVGASDGDILLEFVRESAVMGFIGGLIGLGVGTLIVIVINRITVSMGVNVFEVTLRLAIAVPIFATILGTAAGFFPALAASRRDPVQSLRAE